MESILKVKEVFEQKVSELESDVQPALNVQSLQEIVLYEKMLEIQEQITKLTLNLDKK